MNDAPASNLMTDNKPEATAVADNPCATLHGLLRHISTPVHPRLLAYLLALLFTCILGAYETRRVEVWLDSAIPLPPDTKILPERQTLLPDPDGMRWVIYTQNAIDESSIRLPHWTNGDWYPTGHYVGWSTPPIWWLDGLGYIRHLVTGQDMKVAVDEVSPHYNTFLWILAAATMGAMCIFAYGWRGAVVIPAIYSILCFTKFGVFSPDHHVWILLMGVGMLVCLTVPFLHEGQCRVRTWFVGAALFNAMGLWISAPSQALVLIGVFLGFLFIPSATARRVDAANWRWFAILSAGLSMAASWWEFTPDIPLYLELNNPVHAFSMLIAGIWFWQMHLFAASGRRWDSLDARALVYSVLAYAIVIIPIIVYLPYCFSLADPYLARWEAQIAEEHPIVILDFVLQNGFLFLAVISGLCAFILRFKETSFGERAMYVMVCGVLVVYGYFGISSVRFTETMLACLCIYAAFSLPRNKHDYYGWFAAVSMCFIALGAVHNSSTSIKSVTVFGAPGDIQRCVEYRILSRKLLDIDKGAGKSVMAPPDDSNLISYFSALPVYATSEWTNTDGIKYVCTAFYYAMPQGVEGWAEIQKMLIDRDVGYIAVPKNFNYSSSYTIYDQDRIIDPKNTFAYYLLNNEKDKFVPWLKLESDDDKFRIFSFVR